MFDDSLQVEFLNVGLPHPRLSEQIIPEGCHFNWTQSGLELMITVNGASTKEIEDIKDGEYEFALTSVPESSSIWLLSRFGNSFGWCDAPYNINCVDENNRPTSSIVLPDKEAGLALMVILVDLQDSCIKAIRVIGLAHNFSNALIDALGKQESMVWQGRDHYNQSVSTVFEKYKTPELLDRAIIKMKGGR